MDIEDVAKKLEHISENGCAHGQVSRSMIDNINLQIDVLAGSLKETNSRLFSALVIILAGVITGVILQVIKMF